MWILQTLTVETVEKSLYSYFQLRNLNKGVSMHWDSATFCFNTLQIFGTKCTRTEKQHFLLTLLEGWCFFLGNKWNKQFFVGWSGERKGGEPSLFFFTVSWLNQNRSMAGLIFLFNLCRHLFFVRLCCMRSGAG